MGALGQLLGYNLRRGQLLLFESFSEAVPAGITPAQLTILLLIAANPGIKQTTLAAVLDVDRSTMVRLVDRCAELRFVRRGSSRTDRRVAPPVLTERGRAFIDAVMPEILRKELEYTSVLTPSERAELTRLLRKLNALED
ncbi:MAG TPA: MarR family transcriptional regulator [Candidatus Binatia bacterium]|nr:MarR family transcriptional regulator [Candidatus Binatia bacterium]